MVVTVATEAGLAPGAHNKESYDVKNSENNDIRMNDTDYDSNDTPEFKERKKEKRKNIARQLESLSHPTYGGDINRFDRSCFKPNGPILGTPDYVCILNMGFPKVGSSSLQHILQHSYGAGKARHLHCGSVGYSGKCLRKSVWRHRNSIEDGNLLEECGNFTAFTRKYK